MRQDRRIAPALIAALSLVLSQTGTAFAEPPADGAGSPEATTVKSAVQTAPVAAKTTAPPPSRFGGGKKSNDDLVRTALSFRGARYRYGGTGRRGFDCSGFTRYIWSTEKGVSLPRTAAAQYGSGQRIAPANMAPGDLLFFSSRGRRVGHVGLYVGNNQMMHAANSRTGVRLDKVYGSYWGKRLVGVRRPAH